LQFIHPDGTKRFKTGGKKKGCFFGINSEKGISNDLIFIAEGYATAASIREATGYAVAVAFDAGNLESVARAMRKMKPDARLIICADDDHLTEGHPGFTKAKAAAGTVGGYVAIPVFGADRPDKATDFNDLHTLKGIEAVKSCIDAAKAGEKLKPDVSEDGELVSHSYGGGRFDVGQRGVFFIGKDTEGNEQAPKWVCSRLQVIAKTRDSKSGEWGRLLEWLDDDSVKHQWAMPLELLQGDGSIVRSELARLGLSISPSKRERDLLATYLQVWPINDRARCVERLGWHGGVYVTPSESIGQDGEIVVFQNAHAVEPALSILGSMEQWRDSVATMAAGNSRLVFALSVAFAGPLADIAGEDSGGFHFRGASSSGKSTALKVAASVWGNPNTYPRLWRATDNGLEGLAALHNDGLLILDELSQIDPNKAGEAAYMLANGQGKARASRTGAARQSARWRVFVLSAGEESLAGIIAKSGNKANAGQEIRLADIEADAGAGMGAFEDTHNQLTPNAFALALKDASVKSHGAVGVEWLRQIVSHRSGLADLVTNISNQFVTQALSAEVSGQANRVARRFALVAAAGELATSFDLTGWPQGESVNAAEKCFSSWLESFGGTGNREERAILSQVKAFFEAHGASRFEDTSATGEQKVINRVGFYRSVQDGEREFLVLPEPFRREVCAGLDPKLATKVLLEAGWLRPGNDGKPTQKPRINGMGTPRCYVLSGMWKGEQ
jgi:uncharacterized protein (DUF927 family)